MNIKRNPISAWDMVFCFIITSLFKRFIVIASVRLSVYPSVRLSVMLSTTKFGVRVTHMSRVCIALFWPPPGSPGKFKGQLSCFSFTPIDRLWHDACSLDSMERNPNIRACELSQPWIQFDC